MVIIELMATANKSNTPTLIHKRRKRRCRIVIMPLGEKSNFMQKKWSLCLSQPNIRPGEQTGMCVVHGIYNLTLINMEAVSSNASTT